jgi:hypothetical protein
MVDGEESGRAGPVPGHFKRPIGLGVIVIRRDARLRGLDALGRWKNRAGPSQRPRRTWHRNPERLLADHLFGP